MLCNQHFETSNKMSASHKHLNLQKDGSKLSNVDINQEAHRQHTPPPRLSPKLYFLSQNVTEDPGDLDCDNYLNQGFLSEKDLAVVKIPLKKVLKFQN